MSTPTDVIERLRLLGFRSAPEALRSLLDTCTKSRCSPTEVCEKLVEMERRARDAANLDRRTRTATLGSFTPLDSFDWNHPRKVDKPLYEQLLTLDFLDTDTTCCCAAPAASAKPPSLRTWD